ncbi:Uncharacterised protein [Mycobacteroides abscessus subsp. abscessus]|nr:Uncharacterised protein [Mycobacteroides abscessus subsp. abscessus]
MYELSAAVSSSPSPAALPARSSSWSRWVTANATNFSTSDRFAWRIACSCSCGMSNSYSTRFLMRTAMSESSPSSISGISRGRSSGS